MIYCLLVECLCDLRVLLGVVNGIWPFDLVVVISWEEFLGVAVICGNSGK